MLTRPTFMGPCYPMNNSSPSAVIMSANLFPCGESPNDEYCGKKIVCGCICYWILYTKCQWNLKTLGDWIWYNVFVWLSEIKITKSYLTSNLPGALIDMTRMLHGRTRKFYGLFTSILIHQSHQQWQWKTRWCRWPVNAHRKLINS